MDNETEIVNKYISNLPETLRNYLLNKTWIQKVSLITNANKLTEIQATAFRGEVFLTLIGMENYSDFTNNIQKNVSGVDDQTIKGLIINTEKLIFDEIRPYLLEIEKINSEADKNGEQESEKNLNKDNVLNEIENPAPTKPIISNPAGINIILDAQHNLPEQEKKVLISSASVPSRGPTLNNFKNSFATAPIKPTTPIIPKAPPIQTTPVTPRTFTQPAQPIKPAQQNQPTRPVQTAQPTTPPVVSKPPQPVQPPRPPQPPIPPAPTKYTVDPYREPIE